MFHLPTDILRLIYEFDGTYREKYNKVMKNLYEYVKFKNSIKKFKEASRHVNYNIGAFEFCFIIERLFYYVFDKKYLDLDQIYFYENVELRIENENDDYYSIHYKIDDYDNSFSFIILKSNECNSKIHLDFVFPYGNKYRVYSSLHWVHE